LDVPLVKGRYPTASTGAHCVHGTQCSQTPVPDLVPPQHKVVQLNAGGVASQRQRWTPRRRHESRLRMSSKLHDSVDLAFFAGAQHHSGTCMCPRCTNQSLHMSTFAFTYVTLIAQNQFVLCIRAFPGPHQACIFTATSLPPSTHAGL